MLRFHLYPSEYKEILREDLNGQSQSGFDQFMEKLRQQTDRISGIIKLEADDLNRIQTYALDSGNGYWRVRLETIFKRKLGPHLGREVVRTTPTTAVAVLLAGIQSLIK
jgi:hypothetical protein